MKDYVVSTGYKLSLRILHKQLLISTNKRIIMVYRPKRRRQLLKLFNYKVGIHSQSRLYKKSDMIVHILTDNFQYCYSSVCQIK